MNLFIPAFFKMNEDKRSGYIQYSDGNKSHNLHTKWQAKQFVYAMREIDFDDYEVASLIEQIESCNLIDSDTRLETITDELEDFKMKVESALNNLN